MGEKDIAEKVLADYNDVFADIVNGFLFHGRQVIKEEDLVRGATQSQYKADGKLHEMDRDVSKEWITGNCKIAIYGIENQTMPDKLMPARIIGYDGQSYRAQLLGEKDPVPVVTLVLYFGTKERWKYPTNLKSILRIPEELELYVNDYQTNVFEVAWLEEKELDWFHSDFRTVANFLVQKRKNPHFVSKDKQKFRHVDGILKLLTVITGDRRYEAIEEFEEGKKVEDMCEVAEWLEEKGREKGFSLGREEGLIKGRIQAMLELGVNKEAILRSLTEKFPHMSEEELIAAFEDEIKNM